MQLMLDTANLKEIEQALKYCQLAGVTTNPSIMKKEGNVPFFEHLRAIKALIGEDATLHVQVIGNDCDTIVKEAKRIHKELGDNTFVKIPVSKEGLKAMQILRKEGIGVTATSVYTTFQGIMAVLAGARYMACYYNRMLDVNIDAQQVIGEIQHFIDESGSDCQIIAASFKNIQEITSSFAYGASFCTVPYDVFMKGLSMPCIDKAVEDFRKDWNAVHGENVTIADL